MLASRRFRHGSTKARQHEGRRNRDVSRDMPGRVSDIQARQHDGTKEQKSEVNGKTGIWGRSSKQLAVGRPINKLAGELRYY